MREIKIGEDKFSFKITNKKESNYTILINGQPFSVKSDRSSPFELHVSVDNVIKKVFFTELVDSYHIVIEGKDYWIAKSESESQASAAQGSMLSPMPGKIIKVLVKKGDSVEAGQPLLVMEAMKMEHTLKAPKSGIVKNVLANVNDQVPGDVQLVEFEKAVDE